MSEPIPEWAKKAVEDMPPMTDDECAAVGRILDDIALRLAREAIAKAAADE